MKSVNGLVQRLRRIILQAAGKAAKRLSALLKDIQVVRQLRADGIRNAQHNPPYLAVPVFHPGFPGSGRNQPDRFPVRIAALLPDPLLQVFRDMQHVLHHFPGLYKHITVDALKNILFCRSLNGDQKGIVDMAVSEGFSRTLPVRKGKSFQQLHNPVHHKVPFFG